MVGGVSPDPAIGEVKIFYTLAQPANVTIRVLTTTLYQVCLTDLPRQGAGPFLQTVNLSKAPPGDYRLIVEANGIVVQE